MWSCFYPLSVALCLVSLLAPRCDAATGQRRYKIDLLRNESIEEEAHVIRVAASSSMYWSDTFVRYGRDMVRGWEMFAQWLNKERGGIVLNGTAHSIVFDFIQDYSSNSLVTNVYKSLLKDYDLFFSPYSSGLSRSAADVTDPAGKFLLATGASNTAVFRNRKSSFTTLPPNLEFLDSSFAAFAGYGSKTVAVIKDTDYAACGTAQDSNNSAIKAGLTLYKHYDVDPASSYYSSTVRSIIAELKEHSVESVMGCTYLPLCYEVMCLYDAFSCIFTPRIIELMNAFSWHRWSIAREFKTTIPKELF
jgi:ABC-type branched-subunit amino acid transport system substrate-binding protein